MGNKYVETARPFKDGPEGIHSLKTPKFQVSDRRFWAQDEDLESNAPVPENRRPSYVQELEARTKAAESRLRLRLDELEQENDALRQRLHSQLEKRLEQEKLRLFEGFLEVIDNLERALEASNAVGEAEVVRDGVRLTLELFRQKLRKIGIERLDLMGTEFDPNQAEAVGTLPVDDRNQDGKVVQTLVHGYLMGERILRPAQVMVGKLPEPGASGR
ncbi:MAG TPA: nucleotide exchange factor GrpE [Acidobacteriota bacterium]|nr:nucleotide exchange factor GrpE [Acidobacteriota bacterium]